MWYITKNGTAVNSNTCRYFDIVKFGDGRFIVYADTTTRIAEFKGDNAETDAKAYVAELVNEFNKDSFSVTIDGTVDVYGDVNVSEA